MYVIMVPRISKSPTPFSMAIKLILVTALILSCYCVVHANAQDVYIMFNGRPFSNNSYIPISSIGQDVTTALLCATDNNQCCDNPRNRMGEWYYPNGSAVGIRNAGQNFYRSRRARYVRLNHRGDVTTSVTGLFKCVIPNSNATNKQLHAHIYRDAITIPLSEIQNDSAQNETADIEHYEISYIYQGPCSVSPQNRIMLHTLPPNTTGYTITGLRKGSVYTVTLVSIDTTGQRITLLSATVATPHGRPLGTPQSITATPFSNNITIQWDHTECLEQNSEIVAYNVSFGPSASDERNTVTVGGRANGPISFTAVMLRSCTSYTFEVTAINTYGEGGVQSANVTTRTSGPELQSATFNLRLENVHDCTEWTAYNPSRKVEEITVSIVEALNALESCTGCHFTRDIFTEAFLQCSPLSPQQVTFRAKITRKVQQIHMAQEIVALIEEWINSTQRVGIVIDRVFHTTNASSQISVESFIGECTNDIGSDSPTRPLPTGRFGTDLEAAATLPSKSLPQGVAYIITGAVVGCLLVMAVSIIVIVILVKIYRKKRAMSKAKRNREQAPPSTDEIEEIYDTVDVPAPQATTGSNLYSANPPPLPESQAYSPHSYTFTRSPAYIHSKTEGKNGCTKPSYVNIVRGNTATKPPYVNIIPLEGQPVYAKKSSSTF